MSDNREHNYEHLTDNEKQLIDLEWSIMKITPWHSFQKVYH